MFTCGRAAGPCLGFPGAGPDCPNHRGPGISLGAEDPWACPSAWLRVPGGVPRPWLSSVMPPDAWHSEGSPLPASLQTLRRGGDGVAAPVCTGISPLAWRAAGGPVSVGCWAPSPHAGHPRGSAHTSFYIFCLRSIWHQLFIGRDVGTQLHLPGTRCPPAPHPRCLSESACPRPAGAAGSVVAAVIRVWSSRLSRAARGQPASCLRSLCSQHLAPLRGLGPPSGTSQRGFQVS